MRSATALTLRRKPLRDIWAEKINLEYVIDAYRNLNMGDKFFGKNNFFELLAGVDWFRFDDRERFLLRRDLRPLGLRCRKLQVPPRALPPLSRDIKQKPKRGSHPASANLIQYL